MSSFNIKSFLPLGCITWGVEYTLNVKNTIGLEYFRLNFLKPKLVVHQYHSHLTVRFKLVDTIVTSAELKDI